MDRHPLHISDINTWRVKDRNYYTFVLLTFIFGFFGFDHFYLRSFSTGVQKFLTNIFGLGLWYVWDLIQITTDGNKVRTDGLSSPFDWINGIGRGVFMPPHNMSGGGSDNNSLNPPEKSYLLYTVLAIMFGWLGADKFYIGETFQGIAKIFLCFNIFLFLLGWFWVAWDAFNAFFRTDLLLKDGISPPTPLNYLFGTIDSSIFIGGMPKKIKPTLTESLLNSVMPASIPAIPSITQTAKELLPLLITPPIVKAIENTNIIGNSISSSIHNASSSMLSQDNNKNIFTQSGGGGINDNAIFSTGPGAAIAGVLVAVVLAGGLKGTYDFISKVL